MSVGLALVGCGLIGGKRLKGLGPTSVKVVCDSVADRASKLAATVPGCAVTTDAEAALAHPGVEAVLVATSNAALFGVAQLALSKGKHVFVEKPGATNASDMATLVKLAESQRRCLWVGFNHRFHPAFLKAREIWDSGALGEPMFVRGRYGHGGRKGYEKEWRADPKQSGGGELIDQGVHLIDLSRWFLGDFPSVRGHVMRAFWDMPVEDNAFLELVTGNGKVAWLHASCSEWKNLFSLEIYGKDGKLEITGLGGSYGVERLAYYRMLPEMGPPETTIYEYPQSDGSWDREIQQFAQTVERGGAGNGRDALAVMEIVDKIYRDNGCSWVR